MTALVLLAGLVAFLLFQWIALGAAIAWGQEQTRGGRYFAWPLERRRRFRATLRWQARILGPILQLFRPFSTFDFGRAGFRVRGLTGPWGNCAPRSFESAFDYAPRAEDVIVASPMKAGTTWMLQLVHEVLCRGRGDLVETGRALHAVVPWLEGTRTVPVSDAPLVGAERPARIIKTHLPASHCPLATQARYIVVTRHPVATFASCVDFVRQNAWPYAPTLAQCEAWFTSDELMWWGPWPSHVQGWWEWAASAPNVLFVHYEEMQADLPGIAARVAALLGLAPLTAEELAAISRKCALAYMREHAEAFEMHPPHLRAPDAELFRRGTADRHLDVPDESRRRVAAWCAAALQGGSYPLRQYYPDVAATDATR